MESCSGVCFALLWCCGSRVSFVIGVISTMSRRSQADDDEPVSKLPKTTPEVPVCKIVIPYCIIMSYVIGIVCIFGDCNSAVSCKNERTVCKGHRWVE